MSLTTVCLRTAEGPGELAATRGSLIEPSRANKGSTPLVGLNRASPNFLRALIDTYSMHNPRNMLFAVLCT